MIRCILLNMPGDIIFWTAPTHTPRERSADWYWALGLIALGGIVVSIVLNNALVAIVIAIIAVCLGALAARAPRHCEIHLTEEGIVVDHDMHPYRSLRSFFVFEEHPAGARLLLTTHSIIHPHIALIIGEPAQPN